MPDRDGRRETTTHKVARGALALAYAVAGVAHLVVTDAMVRIVPAWVPAPHAVVIATGVCELAGAAGLMTVRWRRAAGWALALYAVCVFPANIKHAIHDLGGGTGLGLGYHLPRLLLQPVIVWWALWASDAVDWPFGARGRRLAPRVRVP
ncbi:MAG: DoxX family protein [Janthinobacterium lividum]